MLQWHAQCLHCITRNVIVAYLFYSTDKTKNELDPEKNYLESCLFEMWSTGEHSVDATLSHPKDSSTSISLPSLIYDSAKNNQTSISQWQELTF
jgi:hypothetical protein